MQLFSADTTILKKKHPQNLLIIGPELFFSTGPVAQTAQKTDISHLNLPLMQDWVFRLGVCTT